MSPLAVLKRGYAIAENSDGKLLRASNLVKKHEIIRLRLGEGSLRCRIEEIEEH
jgi:exodeoxyribonuclease VII large subunit